MVGRGGSERKDGEVVGESVDGGDGFDASRRRGGEGAG